MVEYGEARVSRERFLRVFIQYTELPERFDGDCRAGASVLAVLDLEREPESLRPTLARQDARRVDALRAYLRDSQPARGAHDLRVEAFGRPADQFRVSG